MPQFAVVSRFDLPKVTTDSSLLNTNLLSNGKRYKTKFQLVCKKDYCQESPGKQMPQFAAVSRKRFAQGHNRQLTSQ